MHASLKDGDFVLMASDGNPEMPAVTGSNVRLAINAPDPELDGFFNALANGLRQAAHSMSVTDLKKAGSGF